ncbi:hypothetical protein AB4Y85_07765 [Microvirga sp. 2YAF29]|uniref:hypothetical protein n=1 Tax=Microvirga sp. 2YAF29 TaxID=3233031 RepID=UPI003F9E3116
MSAKVLTGLIFSLLLGTGPVHSAELKPYQKDALEQLEETHGNMWPMLKPHFEGVIRKSSEEEVKALVKAVTETKGNDGAPGGSKAPAPADSNEEETADSDAPDAWEMAEAAREDLKMQIDKPYEAFIAHVAKLDIARRMISDQSRDGIYNAEKSFRLNGVTDAFRNSKFISSKSIADGLEEVRLVREKLVASKKYYKVSLPTGNPPDNTNAIRSIVSDATARITTLNNQYGKIAATLQKQMNVSYVDQINKLLAERERHNKSLSAEVAKIVADMNTKIAEQDIALFNWMIKPLKEAQPQAGPSAKP